MSDIFSINELTLILNIIDLCDYQSHYDVTDKNIIVQFKGIDIHYHY